MKTFAIFILLASVAVAQTIDPPLPTQPPASATKREKDTYAFAMYWYAEGVKQRAAAIAASKLSAEDRQKLDAILFFVTPKVTQASATVTWDLQPRDERVIMFQIERSSDGITFKEVGFLGLGGGGLQASEFFYKDGGLPVGAVYWYRVKSKTLLGTESPPSNVVKYVAVAP